MAQEEKLGFVYPDLFSSNATTSHHHNPMQSYEPEIMHAAAGMEMLGFFPDKDVASARNPSSSAAATLWRDTGHVQAAPAGVSSTHYYDYGPGAGVGFSHHHHQQDDDPSQLLSPTPQEIGWHPQGAAAAAVATAALYPGMESSSGDHYPGARTLSLSLCNSGTVGAPSPVGTSAQQQLQHLYQQQQQPQPHPLLRGTKYLAAAQGLLAEFCSLEGGADGWEKGKGGKKAGKQPEEGPSSSSSTPPTPSPSLLALDVVELQRRKARLLSMLEEVDRRYKRYCQQMHAVVASFEATTREGAATAYTSMASRAMSRHFRCLRDGVMGQIKAIRRAVEEKSCGQPTTPGTTKGETPRLKILDHYMRQQKAFQQGGGMMEHQPWRPQRGLPERSVSILRAWLFEHFLHPYPSDVDKHILARQTGLSRSQVSNWFINARVRLWKPMVEEMYLEETKEENDEQTSTHAMEDNTINSGNNNSFHMMDNLHNPKPESHSLSSIFRRDPAGDQAARALLGPADLDFFSYSSSNHYQQEQHHPQGQPFGPTGVSLTLGLVQQQQQQQYERGGVSLAFPPGGTCQPVETRVLSVMDGDVQGLPYRNLMGASQLLHDLAG